jgi:hypothetical protein
MFTADRDRLARFEREARLLATLNHPHIGAIYGLEDADGIRALVLELVDGLTLGEVIATAVNRAPSGSEARQAVGVGPHGQRRSLNSKPGRYGATSMWPSTASISSRSSRRASPGISP